jgi:predicted outer membrane repeat protein
MNLTNIVFLNNTATDRGGGLSISSFNYYFLMENCVLERNIAMHKYGGAFYIYADNWYITVKNSDFVDNVADLYGGAIDLYSNNDHVVFINSKVRHGCMKLCGLSAANF